jgi:hypothetical protein
VAHQLLDAVFMRGFLTVVFVLGAAIPAAAQPSMTPPVADTADEPPPPPGTTYVPTTYYAPVYAPYPYPAPVVVAAPARPRRPHGVYFTEGFRLLHVSNDLARYMESAAMFRISLGYRRGNFAFELWGGGGFSSSSRRDYGTSASGLSVSEPSPTSGGSGSGSGDPYYDGHHNDGVAGLGFDVKYLKSLSRNFEVYAKGSLSRLYAGGLGDGPGMGLGVGAQVKGKVPVIGFLFWPLFFTNWGPKCTVAAFMETGYDFYRLHSSNGSTDASLTQWSLGIAVGSEF